MATRGKQTGENLPPPTAQRPQALIQTHLMTMCWTHKQLEELEDPLVCEDVKCVSCDWVNDRQAVNFVFDERVHGVKQAATQHGQLQEAQRNTFKKATHVRMFRNLKAVEEPGIW